MGDNIALTGGIEIEVRKKDGNTEKVKVLALAIEHMLPLLQATDDEVKQIALYAGKDEAWVKTLDGPSQIAILEKGEEINRDFSQSFMERRLRRALNAKKQVARLTDEARGEVKADQEASPSGPPRPR